MSLVALQRGSMVVRARLMDPVKVEVDLMLVLVGGARRVVEG